MICKKCGMSLNEGEVMGAIKHVCPKPEPEPEPEPVDDDE